MTALLSLRVSGNRLTGDVRPHYSMLTNLRFLDLSRNKLTGKRVKENKRADILLRPLTTRCSLLRPVWLHATRVTSVVLEHSAFQRFHVMVSTQ